MAGEVVDMKDFSRVPEDQAELRREGRGIWRDHEEFHGEGLFKGMMISYGDDGRFMVTAIGDISPEQGLSIVETIREALVRETVRTTEKL